MIAKAPASDGCEETAQERLMTRHSPTMRLLAIVFLGSASAPVIAQTAPTQPAVAPDQANPTDIIVTAQRREQSLLKVPLAISAISGQGLTTKGITNSAQLATAVPNLQV